MVGKLFGTRIINYLPCYDIQMTAYNDCLNTYGIDMY